MGGFLSLVIDLTLIGLLVAVIVHVVRLNRRLSILRESRADLERLTQRLLETTGKAEAGLGELKALAGTTIADLEDKVRKAGALRDEMQFLIDTGNQTADRLLSAASEAHGESGGQKKNLGDFISKLKNTPITASVDSKTAADKRPRLAAFQDVPAGKGGVRAHMEESGVSSGDLKSRAERDLLEAIERMGTGASSLARPGGR